MRDTGATTEQEDRTMKQGDHLRGEAERETEKVLPRWWQPSPDRRWWEVRER